MPSTRFENEDLLKEIMDYHQIWLADGSPSPFAALISLRAFAMTIAQDHYARPSMAWSDTRDIAYLNELIHMAKLPTMIQRLMSWFVLRAITRLTKCQRSISRGSQMRPSLEDTPMSQRAGQRNFIAA
ncbi:MAG: hypothetical protein M1816_000528 [Peltula sp. TS41687]|nr:MAG: hypothetical protein M1816_000528 [Peltula sp. TS41687]